MRIRQAGACLALALLDQTACHGEPNLRARDRLAHREGLLSCILRGSSDPDVGMPLVMQHDTGGGGGAPLSLLPSYMA